MKRCVKEQVRMVLQEDPRLYHFLGAMRKHGLSPFPETLRVKDHKALLSHFIDYEKASLDDLYHEACALLKAGHKVQEIKRWLRGGNALWMQFDPEQRKTLVRIRGQSRGRPFLSPEELNERMKMALLMDPSEHYLGQVLAKTKLGHAFRFGKLTEAQCAALRERFPGPHVGKEVVDQRVQMAMSLDPQVFTYYRMLLACKLTAHVGQIDPSKLLELQTRFRKRKQ